MPHTSTQVLGLSHALLTIGRVLNMLTGALLLTCLAASFFFEPTFREFFTQQPARIDPGLLMPLLRTWMLLTVPVIAAVDVLLARLLAMVESVRAGDPFVPENAARLKTIAWCVLAVQVFDLACGVMASAMNAAGSNIEWSFSGATGWVAVVLLFVLATVFEQGTRIRADLHAMI